MKRWLLLIAAAIIAVCSGVAVYRHVTSVAQKKREIAYRAALGKYTETIKPGLRRTEVESYLRARNTPFSPIFGAFAGRSESQYADLVKIGQDTAPWYCNEAYVYVAFEFSCVERYKQNDSDLLERIELFRPYTGCP